MRYQITNKLIVSLLLLSSIITSSISILVAPTTSAEMGGIDSFTLTLPVSCTIDGGSSTTHTQSVVNNQYYPSIGSSTNFTMYCNDVSGYIIYAIGASGSIEGNTNLIGNNGENIETSVYDANNIDTTKSSWSMKLTTTDSSLSMNSGFNNTFHTIPNDWVEVVKKASGTVDKSVGSHVSATYDAYISGTQTAGTYTGQVKYVMFHPSSSTAPTTIAKAFQDAGKTKYNGYYKMQDMSTAICDTVNVFGAASEAELIDIRDKSVYYVAKLDDDHCWMTENLDLDLETTPTNVAALTSENTNLTLYGSKGYDSSNGYTCSNTATTTNCTADGEVITWTPERATIAPGSLSSSTWTNDNNNPYSYDNGKEAPNGEMNGHGYTGNYYNWSAAVASNNSSGYTGGSGNAANSICPAGWRLPDTLTKQTGGYEFSKLLYAYGITKDAVNGTGYATGGFNKIIASPLWFIRSGSIDGTRHAYTSYGYYWSSAVVNNNDAYGLSFNSSNVNPASYFGRLSGRSVRCLAE